MSLATSKSLAIKNSAKLAGWLFLFSAITLVALLITTRVKRNITNILKELTE